MPCSNVRKEEKETKKRGKNKKRGSGVLVCLWRVGVQIVWEEGRKGLERHNCFFKKCFDRI